MSQSVNGTARQIMNTVDIAESERHRILSSRRRRLVLDALVDRSPPIDLGDLAADIAAREADQGLDSTEQEVSISLYHKHVPLLSEVGVVDFDTESNCIVSHTGL